MQEIEDNKFHSITFIDKIEVEPSCMLTGETANLDAVQQVQEDSTAKCRIKEAEEILKTLTRQRSELLKLLKARESQKDLLIGMVEQGERRALGFTRAVVFESERINNLKLALDKLNFANKAYQPKAIKSCLLKEEIHYRNVHALLLHGSRSLATERQILRETKRCQKHLPNTDSCSKLEALNHNIPWLSEPRYRQTYNRANRLWYFDTNTHKQQQKEVNQLKCEREDVIINASVKGTIWNFLGSKDEIKKQIDAMEKKFEDLRKSHLAFRPILKDSSKLMKAIEKDIDSLQTRLREAELRKGHAYEFILKHNQENKENFQKSTCYCEHISDLKSSGEHLFQGEVEKFMSKRKNSKAFKDSSYWKYFSSSAYD